MFEDIIESRMCNGEVRERLHELYDEQMRADGGQLAEQLKDQPETGLDYICRYTYWAQAMAGKYDGPAQYAIMQQLVRAYAMHAVLIGDIAAKVPTAKLAEVQRAVMAGLQAHPMPEAV